MGGKTEGIGGRGEHKRGGERKRQGYSEPEREEGREGERGEGCVWRERERAREREREAEQTYTYESKGRNKTGVGSRQKRDALKAVRLTHKTHTLRK